MMIDLPIDEQDYDHLCARWCWSKALFSEDEWLAAFRQHRLPARLRPSRTVTAYRGATDKGQHGMSWATDIEAAQEYVGRTGELWSTRVRPGMVLAVIERPAGWSELVVDPEKLGDIELVDTEKVRADRGLAMRRGIALLEEERRKDERARQGRADERTRQGRADESRDRMREAVATEVDRLRRPARRAPDPPKQTVLSRMIREDREQARKADRRRW